MVFCGVTLLAQTSPPLAEVRKAAEQGDATAQAKMGRAYFLGLGVPKDAAEALKWYRKAAEQGEPNAQVTLGFMYEKGQGVAQDYSEALGWYHKAAEQGNAIAQYNLGVMYANGHGVAQDYPEAIRWYRKAAEQGNAKAQFYLGAMYAHGLGVTQDYPAVVGWFRKAAEQGEPNAQSSLGFMYERGQGVAQDYPAAVGWYRQAAEQGNAMAQYNLGLMCANGKGVTQDYAEAYMWLNLAASKFSGEEQKRQAGVRDALAKKMTPQQIAEAGRRAQEWKPVGPSPSESTSPGPGSTANAGSAYRAPSPGAAQVSSPTAQDKVPLTGQATSVTPQEPPTFGELFRIDPATGTPTPLERVEVKGVYVKRSVVEFYFEGSASPVSFKAGEPLQFAIRLMSPGDRNDGELNAKEVQRHIRLGRLTVQHFKKQGDVRMLTLGAILLNVQSYGLLTSGLDPKKPDRVAQSFRLTPDIALTPGEYHIWIGGMHDHELDTGAHFHMNYSGHGIEHWAFEIIAR
jgi:hypothetical protein